MKHRFWAKSILAAVMVCCLAGCGASVSNEAQTQGMSPEEYITFAKQTLTETQNYEGALNVVSRMGEGSDSMEATVAMIDSPLCMKADIVNVFSGQTVRTQTYLEETDDGEVSMYMNYGDQWTEMSLTREAALETAQIYDVQENMMLVLEHGQGWTEASEENHQVTLVGSVPAASVYTVVEGGKFLQFSGMSGIAETYYQNVEDVPVTLVLKEGTGEPVSCSLDLTGVQQTVTDNVLKELQSQSEGFAVQEYQVSMDISNLDKLEEISIPAEARNGINYEKEITMNEN